MLIDQYRGLSTQDHIRTHKPADSFLGFDLTSEQIHIDQENTLYRDEFINNAEFYAKETYGKPHAVNYVHEVVQAENKEMRLKMVNRDVLARESYIKGMFNENHPHWLRTRAIKDYEWMVSLEEQLQQAKPGDIFIDASPTAFDISLQERQKYMFGNHSFLRLHQFVEENGKKILRSVALLHYLDPEKQKELYNWLTLQSVEAEDLLGNVSKMEREIGISDLTDVEQVRKLVGIVNNIYIHTPADSRLPADTQVENHILDSHLQTLRPWLESIFSMMHGHANRQDIEKSFHGWENAFRARISGNYNPEEDLHLRNMHTYMKDKMSSVFGRSMGDVASYAQMFAVMEHYIQQEYKPEANMCGNGSGYSDTGSTDIFGQSQPSWKSGGMDYMSMTRDFFKALAIRHDDYECPQCKHKLQGEIKGSHPSTWTPSCPKCEFKFKCASD